VPKNQKRKKEKYKKGILLPPAVGYGLNVIGYFFTNYRIEFRYWPRFALAMLINLINWPFRTYERIFINPRFKKSKQETEVIFILGHWRSGTTHLHNLLTKDPRMGYTTTYQSVFPDTLFGKLGYFLFRGFAQLLMPGRRAGDNVVLGTDLPQEEEFALGANTSFSFYYFWMFPKHIRELYYKSLRFEGANPKKLEKWNKDYKVLINKSLEHTGKRIYLSKNPSHTGRIDHLLRLFPEAKFIHIHRNPIEVYLSTENFFKNMMPHLQLQSLSEEDRKTQVIDLYERIMNDFFDQKKLIPKERFTEIRFDQLEKNPMRTLESIYDSLDLGGFEVAQPYFEKYVEKKKGYEKNKHALSKQLIEHLMVRFKRSFETLDYDIPDSIEIYDENA